MVAAPAVDTGTLLSAAGTVVLAYLLARGATRGLQALSRRYEQYRITIRMFDPLVRFALYGAAVYYILGPILQLSSTQLLAVSGILGAVIGFGLQDLVANVVGGLVLLVEKPYQVGDKVTLGEQYGEVVDIGLRATRVRTPDDSQVVVPNYRFVTDEVVNANTGAREMMVVVEFKIAPDADHRRAAEIVEEAIVTSKFVYVAPDRPYAVRTRDEGFYRSVRGKAYVNDLRNEFAFESDVTERVLTAFDEAGIEAPAAAGIVADEE